MEAFEEDRSDFSDIYCWGYNKNKQLSLKGLKEEDFMQIIERPRLNKSLFEENIVEICSSNQHSLAVNSKGKLLICGMNNFGRLGTAKKQDFEESTSDFAYIESFQVISSLSDHFITQISCGQNHSLCLTNSGIVFQWGKILQKVLENPQKVSELLQQTIVKIDSGQRFSACLSSKIEFISF